MIRVIRPAANAPNRFGTTSATALARLRQKTTARLARGETPDRSDVTPSTYRRAREALARLQHNKCCYCEGWIDTNYSDVEHFRPFTLYWWLAYRWDNLLVACKFCNEEAKGAKFGLVDEATRLVAETDPPGAEKARFLDPADPIVDPAHHIAFQFDLVTRRWVPVPRNVSDRGDYTVKQLLLAHDRNMDARREDEEVAVGRVLLWELARRRNDRAQMAEIQRQALASCAPHNRYVAMKCAILHDIVNASLA